MAVTFLGRAFVFKSSLTSSMSFSPFLSRSFSSSSLPISRISRSSTLLHLRPLTALTELRRHPAAVGLRCFSSRPTTSSLNDPSPNWSNRPPKETILLDGCDFEHWLIVVEPPEGNPTRDEIIESYIKILAQVVGSEEEARMKIYSVSTKHYYAFGCLVSEELSYKIKPLPGVRWVLPDSYLDVKNKDYGGEPFIDGKAVPYDPKYHEEWVRNNARANERSRRNDRPRNFDRSRNFERRRENMQNRDFQGRDAPPMPNRDVQNPMPPRADMGVGPNRDGGPSGGYSNMPNSGPSGYSNMPPSGGGYSNIPPSGGPSGGYSNTPPSGGPTGGYSNMPPSGGPTGGYSNTPPSGGPTGGYSNTPPSGGPTGGYSNTPPSGGPTGGYSNTPPSGGPTGGYSNTPPSGGPSGGYSNMPPSGGPSGGYSNMPPRGGPSGGYSNMPPSGGPSGGYSNMPPSGGPSGGYSNMPPSGGPSGGYSNMPNSGGPSGGYSNMPNSGGPSGGYSNMPRELPSREMGGMQNRDYQNSYMPNRDAESVPGGGAYQGRDTPGRD